MLKLKKKNGWGFAAGGLLVACSMGLSAPAIAEEMTLDATTVLPEGDFSSQILQHWMDAVTEKTDGRIKFRSHWSGGLVGAKMVEGMDDGTVDVALAVSTYVSGSIGDLAVFDIPFMFPVQREALEAFSNEVLPIVDQIYTKEGSHAVAAPPMFLANVALCKEGYLNSPESWSKVRIRTAGRWQAAAATEWGASPVILPLADLYSGLERGTVDCTLMIYNAIDSLKLYEVAPDITRLDHSIAFGTINVANHIWNDLSEADRAIMQEAGREAMKWGFDGWQENYQKIVESLPGKGANLCLASEEEFARLVQGADDVLNAELVGKTSELGEALIEIVQKYRPQVLERPNFGELSACE